MCPVFVELNDNRGNISRLLLLRGLFKRLGGFVVLINRKLTEAVACASFIVC